MGRRETVLLLFVRRAVRAQARSTAGVPEGPPRNGLAWARSAVEKDDDEEEQATTGVALCVYECACACAAPHDLRSEVMEGSERCERTDVRTTLSFSFSFCGRFEATMTPRGGDRHVHPSACQCNAAPSRVEESRRSTDERCSMLPEISERRENEPAPGEAARHQRHVPRTDHHA